LKAVPSAPKIKNPKTDKTEQHVARFVLTSGRDIVEVMKVEWGGRRRWDAAWVAGTGWTGSG
jgi:hypothetical protein